MDGLVWDVNEKEQYVEGVEDESGAGVAAAVEKGENNKKRQKSEVREKTKIAIFEHILIKIEADGSEFRNKLVLTFMGKNRAVEEKQGENINHAAEVTRKEQKKFKKLEKQIFPERLEKDGMGI